MAPNLAASQHELTHGLIESSSLTDRQKSKLAGCSEGRYDDTERTSDASGRPGPPPGRPGRPRSVTPPMLNALCDRLVKKSTLYCKQRKALFE